ncbi:MAG: SDR family oxidoreductase [bacterium]|nr:SDR family oxidoreductase [bacterium]
MNGEGKPCIFITGGGAGIGLATAKLFARNGWFVGIYDCDDASAAAALEALQREARDRSTDSGPDIGCCGRIDVREPASIAAALEDFRARGTGKLDILFNNAGVLSVDPFEDVPLNQHHQHIDVNAKGVVNCCHLAFPMLRDTAGARVISMASASASFGVPDFATYSATKFFVRGLTEALNIEWARHDIQVSDIWPPFVSTPMVTNIERSTAIDKMGVELVAEDVAAVVWQAAHGKKVHWPMTAKFKMLMWFIKFLPYAASRAMIANVTGYGAGRERRER